ncbi:arginine--tRNA ligase [Candidatus Woesearchaeota archaeon]|nr:arginine--tRNA ligase [Candidatus Woesearchaeota archaeon]
MDFRAKIVSLLVKETKLFPSEIETGVTIPPDPALGDYAFPCFKLGGNPRDAALQLQQKIKLPSFLSRVEVSGPYLNFFLNKSFLAQETISSIRKLKKNYGVGKGTQKIVLEYCGPNTNKPLHLGHVRNMALGNAMTRILRFQGNTVYPVNIINDRGIHICQSMLAYQKWGKARKPSKKGDHFVGDYYVMFAAAAKQAGEAGESSPGEALQKEAQEMLLRWERNDKSVRALWKKMNSWVLKGFAQTYRRFGVSFEKEYFESEYYQLGKEIVYDGLRRGIFEKDHTGTVIAPLEKYGLPNKVLLRGNETSLYITQDLYLAQLRSTDFSFDKQIYVVASEQQLHFKQLFAILDRLGKPYARKMHHLSYGMVHLPTGRMKSREGTVIDADDIMDEISTLAEREVRTRHEDLSEKEIKRRAEAIMLAAIKFFMVKTDAIRDIIFNPAESLSFEGETGPYLQYTHARACSVLRKAKKRRQKIEYSLLMHPSELNLVTALAQFPSVIEDAAVHYRPHVLCRYLLDLAQAFNEFYHQCHVISDNQKEMVARCTLVDAVRQVLANGLDVLGIEALKEM